MGRATLRQIGPDAFAAREQDFAHLAFTRGPEGTVDEAVSSRPLTGDQVSSLLVGIAELTAARRWSVRAKVRREIIDFAAERGRHEHFFGREDVLAELDAWVGARERGWLQLTGSPGLGKSALMDQWLRRREAAGSLTAFHFIRRDHLDWADPQVVQRNLAAQVEVMVPEQRDEDTEPRHRLEQLLRRVSPVLVERDERLVLLVDGLDEAMTPGASLGDDPIPKIFPLELPERVFVVTASRQRYPCLTWFEERTGGPFEKIHLDEWIESNEHAVRAYWAALGPTLTPRLTRELLRAAIRGAGGNVLHAVELRALWSKPGVVRTTDAVPRGLSGMLDELWQRLAELRRAQRKLVHDGLALVCAARESLPLRVIEALLDWKEDQARQDFLPLAREMLLEDARGAVPTYRLFHESVRELVERRLAGRWWRSLGAYHRTLAEYASWPVKGDEFRRSYALRHRIEHRVEAGELDHAAEACMDLDFLTAKACVEGVFAVVRDLRLAAEARSDDETRVRLTTLGCLVEESARWANDVPEALPALLHERALTSAPELFRELLGPTRMLPEPPRLGQPLRIGWMSRTIQGPAAGVSALAALPSGRIVSGSLDDDALRVWDAETGCALATLHGHTSGVTTLVVLPDGRLVSGSFDETLRVWDVEMGRALVTLRGHTSGVTTLAVLPDGRIVSGSHDDTLRVWDVETGRALATLQGHKGLVEVNTLAALPDGHVVSGSNDGMLRVWDLEARRLLASLHGHREAVNVLVTLSDGRIVSGSSDRTLRVWDVHMGRALATLHGHTGGVNAVAVLPDGRIVSGSNDETLRVWDVHTGRALAILQGHTDWVNALAVLPDGRTVSGSDDQTLRVWDVGTGRAFADLHGQTGSAKVLAVVRDGPVVSASNDQTLRVWDAETGRALAALLGHASEVHALAVLSDGRIVAASSDHALRVWDAEGRALATLHGHTGAVSALAVLPDGRIASASDDKTLRVWDVQTGRPLATVDGDAPFRSIACVDQHLLVARDAAGDVWFIDLADEAP
jgi:WD40 repeat protein